jgi:hypothetical protein
MRIAGADTAAWVELGLALGHGPARAAFLALADDRPTLPPPGVVGDLLALAAGETLAPKQVPAALRAALGRYQDRVLLPLAGDPALLAAGDAVRDSGEPAVAGALLVALLLDRIPFRGAELDVAALRRARPAEPTPAALAGLLAGYDALAAAARHRPARWVEVTDAGVIAEASALGRLGARLRLRALVDAALALPIRWPRPRARPRGAAAAPAPGEIALGGYAGLVTGARLEGLLPSELLFLGDDQLFLPRWAEGSLLGFARDEGVCRHPRYDLVVSLAPDSSLAALAAVWGALTRRRLAARLTLLGAHPDLALAAPLLRTLAPAGPPISFTAAPPPPRADRVVAGPLAADPAHAVAALLEALA